MKPRVKSESKIFYSFDELPSVLRARIKEKLGYEKLRIFKYRLSVTIKLVASFVNGELASYCFFAFSSEQFSLFRLKKGDIYFFDCFTFPEFRGLGLIYNETKYVIDVFKEHGYSRACVAIDSCNKDSICAFNKIGFRKTKEYWFRRIFFIKKILVK
jgi:GNAT superfamily N-acetyltransferase